jgi:hypothetical protein
VFFGLLVVALAVFWVADWLESAPGESRNMFDWLSRLDGRGAMDRVASSAEVVAGVLAIAITVVAIVVELAANRYTHRITQLFVREPTNFFVMSFFVLTTVLCVWVSTRTGDPSIARVPHAGLILTMGLVTACLLMLLPYFAFVFRFLAPINVVERIGAQATRSIRRATRGMRPGMRADAIAAIEELEDVAHGAREHSDRSISMAAVDALRQLLVDYQPLRADLPPRWFEVDGPLLRDPDFVSMDRTVVAELVSERLWFETKVLRQCHSIFTESLVVARDIANLVALNTRRVGAEAAADHPALLRLTVRFFNSFLRAAINARDLRTAYYVLQQYRLLCESVFEAGRNEIAVEIGEHFRYYGLEALAQDQGFLLEVVAYDLAQLVEYAVENGHSEANALLDLFLEVDRESEQPSQEVRLRGVRRCQVQLATFYLERGDDLNARRIFQDMEDESTERLCAVRDELLREDRPQYWEFTDRGVNFSYLPPGRRAHVRPFFAWFGSRLTDN